METSGSRHGESPGRAITPAGTRAPSGRGSWGTLALAVADREEEISACADAGATEIVRRRADRDELLATIDRALLGDSRLQSLRSALAPERPDAPAREPPALTPCERES